MKSSLRILFALAAFGVLFALAAVKVSADDLLKNADKYNDKIVTVVAEVNSFKQKTSKKGNDYHVMELKAKSGLVNVYGQGKVDKEPKKGDRVEVTGRFLKEKKLAAFTARNEINVTKGKKDEEKAFGIKIVK